MGVNEIIKKRRHELGLTLADVADACSVSEATVSRWENGHIANMKRSRIADLAKVLRISPSIIVGTEETPSPSPIDNLPSNILPLPQTKKVPMLGAVACGEPIYMDEVRGEYYPMDSSIRADFCLKAQGDSMSGARIYDGDIVFIQSSPEVENGQIAAVAVDDEATLKYFYQYGDTVVLRPANPKYEEMTFERDDMNRLRIFGRAVAFQSAL